jgi:hypothetical protein
MEKNINAQVVLSRCQKSGKLYGIRVEERNGDWVQTWAFKIDENKAKHEKFDSNRITGSMKEDPGFPGCPYCGKRAFFVCSCGKLNCHPGERGEDSGDCRWCGKTVSLKTAESFDIDGGSY